MSTREGKLVLVGTPLGNREDLSPRARRALLEADLLLCEDTRSPSRLLGPEAMLPPRQSCFVGNEHERTALLLERLAQGDTVAFVSEAGMPVWSDPGRMLVQAAVQAGYEVDVVPGPTAAATVLALSGLPAERARFVGFVDRSGPGRRAALEAIANEEGPSLLYEAGNRMPALLRDLAQACDDAEQRQIVIGRELTKLHQEVLRGSLSELAERVREPLRGEVSLVVQGRGPQHVSAQQEQQAAARAVLETLLDPSLKPRERAKKLAELTGLDAREIYARLQAK